ncbi:MAG: tetratricopeptide repeat protein, partial [Sulfurihydrogenibium sp.]|uniref:tetratricopeptide repeat protein n=1 Tax=Sulfurihydrogenibium sp. TaxID=2053621 RepID=UPI003C7C4D13
LVQTFLGNQDLENAYEVSKKALELFPNDPYWLKTFGQVAIWNKKPKEGLEAYLKLYQLTKDENLKKDIFNLSISVDRFDIAKQLIEEDVKSGKFTDMQTVYYIYYQAGAVKELVPILENLYIKNKNKNVLYTLSTILYNLGEIKKSLIYAEKLVTEHNPDLKDVLLYSTILYSNREFRRSLEVLKSYYDKVNQEKDKNIIKEYLSNLSDLAWTLRDFDAAVKASEKLCEMNLAELRDYIRLYTYYFYEQQYKLSQKYAYEGYKKYKMDFLLEGYIESIFRLEEYEKLVDFVDSENIDISKSTLIFSRYINSLIKIGQKEKAIKLALKTLEKKFKSEFLIELIYISIDTSDQKLAKLILSRYSNYENQFKKEFGFLYYFLQNGKKALQLLSSLKHSKNYSDLIVYADLLNLYGKTVESDYLKFKIFKILREKINSGNYTDNDLENFLKVAVQFLPSRQYTEILKIAKPRLNPQVYQDIINSYYITIDSQNKIEFLIKMHNYSLRPWMRLNIALLNDDRYLQQELLQEYIDILPIRDKVEALRRVGEIDKAMEYGYKGLDENPDDYLLYKQQRDLIVQNRPKVEIKTSYTERGDVSEITENIYLSAYVAEGIKVFVKYKNSDIQSLGSGLTNLKNPQDYGFGIEKIFDDGKLTITFGVLSTLNSNPYFDIIYSKYMTNRINSGVELGINIPADDTLYLLYGGMKNKYGFSINYSITNRLNYFINPSYNQYYSSDKVSIGTSFNVYEELYYKLRVGYPDYTFRIYTSHGYYNEKDGYKGSIERISKFNNPKVLPSSYNQVGVGFLFGYENDNSFVRVVRPFFSVDLSYNDVSGVGYGFGGGIGGSLFRQDNLSLGFNYYKGFKGTMDKYFNTYIRYLLFY